MLVRDHMRCMSALGMPVKGGWQEPGEAGHSTLFPRAMLYIDTRYTIRPLPIYEYRLPGAFDARARYERAVAGAIASLNLDAWKGQKEKTDSCRKRQLNTI